MTEPGQMDFLLDAMRAMERKSAILGDVAGLLRSAGNVEKAADEVLSRVAELADAGAGLLLLVGPEGGGLRFAHSHWPSVGPTEAARRAQVLKDVVLDPDHPGPFGEAHRSGQPRIAAGPEAGGAFPEAAAAKLECPVSGLLAVPLGADLGVLALINKKSGEFSTADLDLVSALCAQLALGLEAGRFRALAAAEKEKWAKKHQEMEDLRDKSDKRAARLEEDLAAARRQLEQADQRAKRLAEEVEEAHAMRGRGASQVKELTEELEAARGLREKDRQRALALEKELAGFLDGKKDADAKALQAQRDLEAALQSWNEAEEKAKKAEEALAAAHRAQADEDGKKGRELEDARRAQSDAEQAKDREIAVIRRVLEAAEEKAARLDQELEAARRAAPAAVEESRQDKDKAQAAAKELMKELDAARRALREKEAALQEKDTALKAAEERAAKSAGTQHVVKLLELVKAVNSIFSLRAVLDNLALMAEHVVLAGRTRIYLAGEGESFHLAAGDGAPPSGSGVRGPLFPKGRGLVGGVLASGQVLRLENPDQDPRHSPDVDAPGGAAGRCLLAVPIDADARRVGVMAVLDKKEGGAFSEKDAHLLFNLCAYGAMAIEKARFYQEAEDTFVATLCALADAIDARGAGVRGRADRLRRLALLLGEELFISGADARDLEWAAILQGVGNVAVPDAVLAKNEDLKPKEYEALMRAPLVGAQVLEGVKGLRHVARLVRHVNERWDGKGYPDGLAGEDIPLGSRALGVVAAYEAMVTDRPYRRGLPPEVAMKELASCAGHQFDPACVEAFQRLRRKGKLV